MTKRHGKSFDKQTSQFRATDVVAALESVGYEKRAPKPITDVLHPARPTARKHPDACLTRSGDNLYLDFKGAANPEGRALAIYVPVAHMLTPAQVRNIQRMAKIKLSEVLNP